MTLSLSKLITSLLASLPEGEPMRQALLDALKAQGAAWRDGKIESAEEGSDSEEYTFDLFWNAYAFKRDRKAAERAWDKLSVVDRKAAFTGIARYKADCARQGISIMYAQGYLTHRRWEDEINDNYYGTEKTRRANSTTNLNGRMVQAESGENAAPRYNSTI